MKKQLLFFAIGLILSMASSAQAPRQVEKSLLDPNAASNGAKADVLIINSKKITDSSTLQSAPAPVKKEKRCKRKKRAAPKS